MLLWRDTVMPLIKRIFAIHSNPVNLVGALVVLYALITTSWSLVVVGAVVWTIGFFYQRRLPPKED